MKRIVKGVMGCLVLLAASQVAMAQQSGTETDDAYEQNAEAGTYTPDTETGTHEYIPEADAYAVQEIAPTSMPMSNGCYYGPGDYYNESCYNDISCQKNAYYANRTRFGGWLQGGLMVNSDGNTGNNPFPGNIGQGTTGSTDMVLNQAWIYGERRIDKRKCGWDWGWRADFAYGSDMPGWQTFGDISDPTLPNRHNLQSFDHGWMSSGGGHPNDDGSILYGAALPQLYGVVKYNNLSLKVGRFLSPFSYESIMAPDDHNYFYSHSYAFNYLSPHTLSGLMAEWAINCKLSLFGGWSNGWDNGPQLNDRDGSTFNGGVRWNINRCAALSYMLSMGDLYNQPGLNPDGYFHSIMLDWQLSKRLRYGLETMYANFDADGQPDGMKWWNVANYLSYTFNCRWAAALRFEYVSVDNVFSTMNPFAIGNSANINNSDIYSVTLGATWKPGASKHLSIRPELRYDWLDRATGETSLLSAGVGATYVF